MDVFSPERVEPATERSSPIAYQALAFQDAYVSARFRVIEPFPETIRLTLHSMVDVAGVALSTASRHLAGARILSFSDPTVESGWFDAAVSGNDGAFHLAVPPGAEFEIAAKLPGSSASKRLEWHEGAQAPPIVMDFGRSGVVEGIVRYPDGRPVEAAVRVVCRTFQGALVSAVAYTDSGGAYRFEGMPVDRQLLLFVDLLQFYPAQALTPALPSDQSNLTFDLNLLPTATVRGIVLDPHGQPQPHAFVEVVSVSDRDGDGTYLRWREEILGLGRAETEADGRFVAEHICPRGKVLLWAYHPEWGEQFTSEVSFPENGSGDVSVEVRLDAAGLRVEVTDENGRPRTKARAGLTALPIWDKVPSGMNLGQWFNRRTSMDVSRYAREFSITPGERGQQLGEDGSVEWRDLMASRYQVYVLEDVGPEAPANWDQEYWLYQGALERDLVSLDVSSLKFAVYLERTVSGKVTDASGQTTPPLRVQAYFTPAPIPGLVDLVGYSVTHTRQDGTFELVGLGPGPYVITFGDRQDHLVEIDGVEEGTKGLQVNYAPEKKTR